MPSPRQLQAGPLFGQFLKRLRGSLSNEDVAERMRPLVAHTGLKVDQAALWKIENGAVPSWHLLAGYSAVFKTPIREFLDRLIPALQLDGVDLLGQSGTGQWPNAATRLLELETERDRLRARLDAAEAIAADLVGILSDGQTAPARTRTTRSRRRAEPTD